MLAIFNSLPFHYEMFGYIIYYSKINNFKLDIYTNEMNNYGWIDFYLNKGAIIKPFMEIYKNIDNYDLIFLLTDDDRRYIGSNKNVICIDHHYTIRNTAVKLKNHIAVRPFSINYRFWALPCYIINERAMTGSNESINIGICGGRNDYKLDILNNFYSPTRPIIYHLITRECDPKYFKNFKNKINIYLKINTDKMMDILNNCNYILTDISNDDHIEGRSMSAVIPLAISLLKPLIISKKNNELYKFKNVYTFTGGEKINIDDFNSIDYTAYKQERDELIATFHNKINDILAKKMAKMKKMEKNIDSVPVAPVAPEIPTALIVEPRKIPELPIIINDFMKKLPNFKFVFYCGKGLSEYYRPQLKPYNQTLEIRELPINNFTPDEYSAFFKTKELWENLYGEYVLVFQYDTFILNKAPYNIEYYMSLNQSYIGGNISYEWHEFKEDNENLKFKYQNFNGGLSLRKRKDMIAVIDNYKPNNTKLAEDVYFTIGCHKLNLGNGNIKECNNFALHCIYYSNYFGVHKPRKFVLDNLMSYLKKNKIFYKNLKNVL